MKSFKNPVIHDSFRWVTVSLFCITLLACSSVSPEQTEIARPGNYLLNKMTVDEIADTSSLQVLLKTETQNPRLPEQVKNHLDAYPQLSGEILLARQSGLGEEEAAIDVYSNNPNRAVDIILITLALYPDQGEQIVEELLLNDSFTEADIQEGWLLAKRDPLIGFPPTAASNTGVKIQPLFNSASITVFERSQMDRASIRFKQIESEEWQAGLDLQWDPVRGALSGSIVKLDAETRYQIELRLTTPSGTEESRYDFVTRSESPPINPDLVYQLADIYNGGMLDLQALNIKGAEDGWAKIIGSPDTPVIAGETDRFGINIGNSSYIVLENVTVKGGYKYGIRADRAHHIWIKGCDISAFGQKTTDVRNGKAYASASDSNPINYDAGIGMYYTGVVTVENCTIHSPNSKANSWQYGHPKGPSAMLVLANNKNPDYQGQYVIRHNRFFGTDNHRFNDILESRSNGRVFGGLLRDSAVHDNYFAYANDDLIELDGGQSNVLVYNNELEQGFVGISAIPNMLGPSYIFNNHIHNLGDERGAAWTAIKLGGLITAPAGITMIFENLIENRIANGIAASKYKGDYTFWADARNNVILSRSSADTFGFGILDRNKYSSSVFKNNFIYNQKLQRGKVDAQINEFAAEDELSPPNLAEKILSSPASSYPMPFFDDHIPNFSDATEGGGISVGISQPGTEE